MKKIYLILLIFFVISCNKNKKIKQINWDKTRYLTEGAYPRILKVNENKYLLFADFYGGIKMFISSSDMNWKNEKIIIPQGKKNYVIANPFPYKINEKELLLATRLVNDYDKHTDVKDRVSHYMIKIYKSHDAGETWKELSTAIETGSDKASKNKPGGVWEPYLISNPKNKNETLLFYAREIKRDGNEQVIALKRSNDYGKTWSKEEIVSKTKDSRDGMPVVSLSKEKNLYLVYEGKDKINNNDFAIYMKSSTNGGKTWGEKKVIYVSNKKGYGSGAPFLVIDKFDNFIVSFQEGDKLNNSSFNYIISSDKGQTWSDAKTIFFTGLWNSLYLTNKNIYALSSGIKIKKGNIKYLKGFC